MTKDFSTLTFLCKDMVERSLHELKKISPRLLSFFHAVVFGIIGQCAGLAGKKAGLFGKTVVRILPTLELGISSPWFGEFFDVSLNAAVEFCLVGESCEPDVLPHGQELLKLACGKVSGEEKLFGIIRCLAVLGEEVQRDLVLECLAMLFGRLGSAVEEAVFRFAFDSEVVAERAAAVVVQYSTAGFLASDSVKFAQGLATAVSQDFEFYVTDVDDLEVLASSRLERRAAVLRQATLQGVLLAFFEQVRRDARGVEENSKKNIANMQKVIRTLYNLDPAAVNGEVMAVLNRLENTEFATLFVEFVGKSCDFLKTEVKVGAEDPDEQHPGAASVQPEQLPVFEALAHPAKQIRLRAVEAVLGRSSETQFLKALLKHAVVEQELSILQRIAGDKQFFKSVEQHLSEKEEGSSEKDHAFVTLVRGAVRAILARLCAGLVRDNVGAKKGDGSSSNTAVDEAGAVEEALKKDKEVKKIVEFLTEKFLPCTEEIRGHAEFRVWLTPVFSAMELQGTELEWLSRFAECAEGGVLPAWLAPTVVLKHLAGTIGNMSLENLLVLENFVARCAESLVEGAQLALTSVVSALLTSTMETGGEGSPLVARILILILRYPTTIRLLSKLRELFKKDLLMALLCQTAFGGSDDVVATAHALRVLGRVLPGKVRKNTDLEQAFVVCVFECLASPHTAIRSASLELLERCCGKTAVEDVEEWSVDSLIGVLGGTTSSESKETTLTGLAAQQTDTAALLKTISKELLKARDSIEKDASFVREIVAKALADDGKAQLSLLGLLGPTRFHTKTAHVLVQAMDPHAVLTALAALADRVPALVEKDLKTEKNSSSAAFLAALLSRFGVASEGKNLTKIRRKILATIATPVLELLARNENLLHGARDLCLSLTRFVVKISFDAKTDVELFALVTKNILQTIVAMEKNSPALEETVLLLREEFVSNFSLRNWAVVESLVKEKEFLSAGVLEKDSCPVVDLLALKLLPSALQQLPIVGAEKNLGGIAKTVAAALQARVEGAGESVAYESVASFVDLLYSLSVVCSEEQEEATTIKTVAELFAGPVAQALRTKSSKQQQNHVPSTFLVICIKTTGLWRKKTETQKHQVDDFLQTLLKNLGPLTLDHQFLAAASGALNRYFFRADDDKNESNKNPGFSAPTQRNILALTALLLSARSSPTCCLAPVEVLDLLSKRFDRELAMVSFALGYGCAGGRSAASSGGATMGAPSSEGAPPGGAGATTENVVGGPHWLLPTLTEHLLKELRNNPNLAVKSAQITTLAKLCVVVGDAARERYHHGVVIGGEASAVESAVSMSKQSLAKFMNADAESFAHCSLFFLQLVANFLVASTFVVAREDLLECQGASTTAAERESSRLLGALLYAETYLTDPRGNNLTTSSSPTTSVPEKKRAKLLARASDIRKSLEQSLSLLQFFRAIAQCLNTAKNTSPKLVVTALSVLCGREVEDSGDTAGDSKNDSKKRKAAEALAVDPETALSDAEIQELTTIAAEMANALALGLEKESDDSSELSQLSWRGLAYLLDARAAVSSTNPADADDPLTKEICETALPVLATKLSACGSSCFELLAATGRHIAADDLLPSVNAVVGPLLERLQSTITAELSLEQRLDETGQTTRGTKRAKQRRRALQLDALCAGAYQYLSACGKFLTSAHLAQLLDIYCGEGGKDDGTLRQLNSTLSIVLKSLPLRTTVSCARKAVTKHGLNGAVPDLPYLTKLTYLLGRTLHGSEAADVQAVSKSLQENIFLPLAAGAAIASKNAVHSESSRIAKECDFSLDKDRSFERDNELLLPELFAAAYAQFGLRLDLEKLQPGFEQVEQGSFLWRGRGRERGSSCLGAGFSLMWTTS